MIELEYRQVGDYLLPDLGLAEEEQQTLGKYGMLRHSFLREHRKTEFSGMMLKGTLNSHLEETDRRANEMMEALTKQMAEEQKVTEKLKAENQMLWVQMMNNIRNRAEEIVLNEVVYS